MKVSLSFLHQFLLVLLRFVVGWHLFYQGLGKRWIVGWSAKGYLENASGPLDNVFQALADRPGLMNLTDFAVVWGLMLVGLLLMLGLFSRLAALAGFLLLFLFFAATPPMPYFGFSVPGPEGSELYVNKTLIEALVLLVLAIFPTGYMAGLDILVSSWRRRRRSVFSRRD